MTKLLMALQIPVYVVLAMEAALVAAELDILRQEVATAPVIRAAVEQKRKCADATWPDIPDECLERVSALSKPPSGVSTWP